MQNTKITDTERILKSNLTRLRKERGVTRYHVAKALGFSVANYTRYEDPNVHKEPKYCNLEKLADYYGIKFYELYITNQSEE